MIDNWQRLERIIKWTGLSINSFALSIGLKRSENLYQIKKGNNGISRDLVELIAAKYPSVSKGWLMTGEGEMFIEQSGVSHRNNIPYFGIDAPLVATAPAGELPEPIYYMNIPAFPDSTFAALTLRSAMQPEIPAGSTVILKETDPKSAIPGEAYLVISESFRDIRHLRLSPDPSEYTLVPINLEEFDPITISRDSIKKLYLVTGVIIKRSQ